MILQAYSKVLSDIAEAWPKNAIFTQSKSDAHIVFTVNTDDR
jgi:hypothetical protein